MSDSTFSTAPVSSAPIPSQESNLDLKNNDQGLNDPGTGSDLTGNPTEIQEALIQATYKKFMEGAALLSVQSGDSKNEQPPVTLGGAPKLPPPPDINPYKAIEMVAWLTTANAQTTTQSMIYANNGMSAQQETELQAFITELGQAIAAAAAAQHKSHVAKIFGWVANITMAVVGFALVCTGIGAGLGAGLLVGGLMGCVMMTKAGTAIVKAMTHLLEDMGVPKKDAEIVAQVLVAVIIIVASVGLAGAVDAGATAARTAIKVAWEAGENMGGVLRVGNAALKGFEAFGKGFASSLADSTGGGVKAMLEALKSLKDLSIDGAIDSMSSGSKAVLRAIIDALKSLLESLQGLTMDSLLAALKSLPEDAGKALMSFLRSMNPYATGAGKEAWGRIAQLLTVGLGGGEEGTEYDANQANSQALIQEAEVIRDNTGITELSTLIKVAILYVGAFLKDMNENLTALGQTAGALDSNVSTMGAA